MDALIIISTTAAAFGFVAFAVLSLTRPIGNPWYRPGKKRRASK